MKLLRLSKNALYIQKKTIWQNFESVGVLVYILADEWGMNVYGGSDQVGKLEAAFKQINNTCYTIFLWLYSDIL